MRRPVIGITADRNDEPENIESHYFLRRNYCSAIAAAGGLALILPYQAAEAEAYLDLLDGLVISGGNFDIDPALYGMRAAYPATLVVKPDRTAFEQCMLRGALARQLPVLGICGGMQLIAVEMGARLHQHLPSELPSAGEHKQTAPCSQASHTVTLADGSRLRQLLGAEPLRTNSLHHQSVITDGAARLRIAGVAADGVIEAVEVPDLPFCIGVQWHPEYAAGHREQAIFAALVRAAQSGRRP